MVALIEALNFLELCQKLLPAMQRCGKLEMNWGEEFFLLYSWGLLRYTQTTTKNVVIRAPAIPDMTHSAERINGRLAANQGHTVWRPMFTMTPPKKPNRANTPSIFILSLILFTMLLTVKTPPF